MVIILNYLLRASLKYIYIDLANFWLSNGAHSKFHFYIHFYVKTVETYKSELIEES